MVDLSTFEHYFKLADMLIGKATKEQVAECGRLLALNLPANIQTIASARRVLSSTFSVSGRPTSGGGGLRWRHSSAIE